MLTGGRRVVPIRKVPGKLFLGYGLFATAPESEQRYSIRRNDALGRHNE
jgi:hypothetical protein